MFISLLFSVCSPSLTRQSTDVGPHALRNDGVERVAEHPAGTTLKTADVAEVAGFFEVAFDQPHVPRIIQLVPNGHRFAREAAVSMLPHPTNPPSWRFGSRFHSRETLAGRPSYLCRSSHTRFSTAILA